jgi:hypothetical protein
MQLLQESICVNVTIPGTIDAYAVNERGKKRKATDALWLETYLYCVLRAFSYVDEGDSQIVGYWKFNPITSTELEHRFLDTAERLFCSSKGSSLGRIPILFRTTLLPGCWPISTQLGGLRLGSICLKS